MVKHNSELSTKGVAPKPKKLIGKMKVQGSFSCWFLPFNHLLFKESLLRCSEPCST